MENSRPANPTFTLITSPPGPRAGRVAPVSAAPPPVPFWPVWCIPSAFRYRILVLLSLGLEGFFLVCRKTLEKASFMCWSTVFNRKYLYHEQGRGRGRGPGAGVTYRPPAGRWRSHRSRSRVRQAHTRTHCLAGQPDGRGAARLSASLGATPKGAKSGESSQQPTRSQMCVRGTQRSAWTVST